jgi:hypothetical protein
MTMVMDRKDTLKKLARLAVRGLKKGRELME